VLTDCTVVAVAHGAHEGAHGADAGVAGAQRPPRRPGRNPASGCSRARQPWLSRPSRAGRRPPRRRRPARRLRRLRFWFSAMRTARPRASCSAWAPPRAMSSSRSARQGGGGGSTRLAAGADGLADGGEVAHGDLHASSSEKAMYCTVSPPRWSGRPGCPPGHRPSRRGEHARALVVEQLQPAIGVLAHPQKFTAFIGLRPASKSGGGSYFFRAISRTPCSRSRKGRTSSRQRSRSWRPGCPAGP
jgi:hypothetical protein